MCVPNYRTTERVYVAATKASPATDEPVKRTAAKAPAKKAPAKKAATKTAAKPRAAKSADAPAGRSRAKKATSPEPGGVDDDLAGEDVETDTDIEGEPGEDLEDQLEEAH